MKTGIKIVVKLCCDNNHDTFFLAHMFRCPNTGRKYDQLSGNQEGIREIEL